MQSLLRRSSAISRPPICFFEPPFSLPLCTSRFPLRGSCAGAPDFAKRMATSGAAFHPLHQLRSPLPTTGGNSIRLAKPLPYGYRPCGCSLESGLGALPFKHWVVFEESGYGGLSVTRRAGFCTLGGVSEKDAGGIVLGTEHEGGNEVENLKARVQRRQRGGGVGSSTAVERSPDLLTIPGVGPRNFKKLVEKGFEGVAQLKQLYKDKFFGKSSEKMVEFLQCSVGIIHKNHAESITTYIKESVDEELKDRESMPAQKNRITLCVEGNISVGKTTFLQRIANETLELRDLVEVVPEPIDKWQNIGPDHFNILDAFYAEPERYAYTFQNYVFVTRVMQERESSGGIKPLRLMERSVFSDRMVFVRAVHEAKWMNEMEISIYDSWFDPVVSTLPGLVPDGFIYLRASPDTCHKRMMLRKRSEEGGVTLDYLRDLHEKHESWLFPFESGNHGVLSVSRLSKDIDWSLHPNIRDRVVYLDGDHMHSSIRKVPALVLDCEPDIDFSRDIEAKREYARQVAEFFEFVKNTKQVSTDDAKGNQPQVLLPHQGEMWLPGSVLSPEDLRRAVSSMSQKNSNSF